MAMSSMLVATKDVIPAIAVLVSQLMMLLLLLLHNYFVINSSHELYVVERCILVSHFLRIDRQDQSIS